MDSDEGIKINARHLSNPGPRLLVENILSKKQYSHLRVIVSSIEAAEDLKALFTDKGAKVDIDQIADEYHILVDFSTNGK